MKLGKPPAEKSNPTPEDLDEIIRNLESPTPCGPIGETDPSFWACGNCRSLHQHEINARQCYYCAPKLCECGKLVPARNYCHDCPIAAQKAEERGEKAFQKATKVQEKDYAGSYICYGDEFYHDADELRDRLPRDEWPAWVWACREVVPFLDIGRALEHIAEDTPTSDDYDWEWEGMSELNKAVDQFNEKQTVCCYEEDSTVAVVLDNSGYDHHEELEVIE